MLYIYDNLVDVIQKHLEERQIDADVIPHIGRAWHCYRFIQVVPRGITSSVHYEYINGYWELHFENSSDDAEVDGFVVYMPELRFDMDISFWV